MLGGFDLGRVLLVDVPERLDIRMTEQRVVLEADLRVEADKGIFLGHDKRVDLDQARVLLDEDVVERLDQLGALLGEIAP